MSKAPSTKTYTIGGTSILNGVRGFRMANGKVNVRRNMLRFKEHTAIKLIELPRPMTRVQVVAHLMSEGFKGTLPTRATNKRARSPILDQAEALIAKKAKAAATRKANQAKAANVEQASA